MTGVDKGPEYEQAMSQLKEFYANQEREAQHVAEVSTRRTEQVMDATTGTPMVNPDGSPYGYQIR